MSEPKMALERVLALHAVGYDLVVGGPHPRQLRAKIKRQLVDAYCVGRQTR